MSDFRYPHITGRTNGEKIDQIVSFLRQLVDQLNYEDDAVPAENQEEILSAIHERLGIKE